MLSLHLSTQHLSYFLWPAKSFINKIFKDLNFVWTQFFFLNICFFFIQNCCISNQGGAKPIFWDETETEKFDWVKLKQTRQDRDKTLPKFFIWDETEMRQVPKFFTRPRQDRDSRPSLFQMQQQIHKNTKIKF